MAREFESVRRNDPVLPRQVIVSRKCPLPASPFARDLASLPLAVRLQIRNDAIALAPLTPLSNWKGNEP